LISLVNYENTLYVVSLLTLDRDKILLYKNWFIILPNDELLKKKIYNFIKLLFIYQRNIKIFLNSDDLILLVGI